MSVPLPHVIGFILILAVMGCIRETPPQSPSTVTSQLVTLLKDSQPEIRRTAALSLGKISEPTAIGSLIQSLSDPDEEVRQWSVWALGTFGDHLTQEGILALIQMLADPSERVKQSASMALGRTAASEEALRVLGEAFNISNTSTQAAIIQALSDFSFPFTYNIFLDASRSPDPFIRQTAVAGLGELGDPRGLTVLRTRLRQDPNIGVRAEAAYRLGKLGSKKEVEALQQSRDTDPTPTVHFWASWALHQIQDNL
ncbi:MAG: HEAT repeat domain-containing protein [Nitrospira sp.]|nr:HEAT repeat domain-containing protein [Nitrospira sp.]